MSNMKIAAWPNPSGSSQWRLQQPFKYLRKMDIEAYVCPGPITEEIAREADIYVLQSCVDKEGIALLYMYQQEFGKKIVVDCDDGLVLDESNPFKADHDAFNATAIIQRTLEIADLVTTTTPYLSHRLKKINPNVQVFPNYLDLELWEKPKLPSIPDRIRIGWAGSVTHLEDLQMIVEPLKQIKQTYPQVELIFCGDPRIRELFGDVPVEVMLGVPAEVWPTKLAGLRLDIGLAPLRDTEFNRCKSNIKWLEYAINKIPGVYSPTVYNFPGFDGRLGQIAESPDQWYRILENYILYPTLREDIASRAYAWVRRQYDLSRHATKLAQVYASLLSS